MGSINAQQTAFKVLETIGTGKKVNMGEIIKKQGYSPKTALTPTLVTNTKSYRQTLEWSKKPILEGIQTEINRVKAELASRNPSQEEYRTLVGSLDIYIKNYQLLSGGATERQVFVLPSEVMERNAIQESKDNDA